MIHEKAVTGSTNDDVRALALDGAPHGEAVLANAQTRGRGRAGRPWTSPEGGFYLSVLLRPTSPPAQWGLLPPAFGAAAARALRAMGFTVGVKWPNDLMLAGEKLGGLLVESRLNSDPFLIVGIGINLHAAPITGATFLARVAPPPPARELAEALVAAFTRAVDRLDAGGAASLRSEVRDVCVSLGRSVIWEGKKGVAVDVDEDGALVVDIDGVHRRIVAGDVSVQWSG